MEAKVFSKSSTYETYVAACQRFESGGGPDKRSSLRLRCQPPPPPRPHASSPDSVCGGNHGVRGDGGGI